jgi:succinate-semialdehyde dehydrogenase/glutarate-semialdehyde dehydrogenase
MAEMKMHTRVLEDGELVARSSIDLRGSFIDGRWLHTGNKQDILNPATGCTFAQVSRIDPVSLTNALQAAEAAFAPWRNRTALERGAVLHRVADALLRRRSEIARTITMENGKPLSQSEGEVSMAVDHLRWFAEEARRIYGAVFLIKSRASGISS